MKMRASHVLITAVLLVAALLVWFVTSPEIPASKPASADTPGLQPQGNPNLLIKDRLIHNPPPPAPTQVPPVALLPSPPEIDPKVAAAARQNFYNDTVNGIAAELSTTTFFRDLPEDKRSKLLKTLADDETSFMEYASRLAMQGKILDERQLLSRKKEQEQNVKSVLSDAEYREYEQFEATRPDRSILAQTSDRLEQPLSDETSKRLLSILLEERQTLMHSLPQAGDVAGEAIVKMTERIKERAASVLQSDEERAALQDVLQGISSEAVKTKLNQSETSGKAGGLQ